MIIYKITNSINDKIYIGQTIQKLQKRWNSHCRGNNNNIPLYNSIKKYGEENFIIEQIDTANSRNELNDKEVYWIKYYNSISPNGYNLRFGGNQYSFSDETKKKMSDAQKEVRKKIPHPLKNKIGKLNVRSKPVLCLNNNIIYESGRQAALELGLNRSHINEIARGKPGRKSSKGYKFKYI